MQVGRAALLAIPMAMERRFHKAAGEINTWLFFVTKQLPRRFWVLRTATM